MMGKQTNVPDICKNLVKALRSVSYSHTIYEVFQDWLAVSAIAISNAVDLMQRKRREEVYMEIIQKYTKSEQEKLAEAFADLVLALQHEQNIHGPTDILGQVFHALELHSKYKGQFFTPPHVCELMGMISFDGNNLTMTIEKKGYVTVCEPCIGSGGMVLGTAKAMLNRKLNYQTQMLVTGNDIDIKCVQMAYLQLSLLGIPAVIIHGNSLTGEEWSRWYTPAYITGLWSMKEQESQLEDLFIRTKDPKVA
jgi:type I restriction-modification system DNA methylase subunit